MTPKLKALFTLVKAWNSRGAGHKPSSKGNYDSAIKNHGTRYSSKVRGNFGTWYRNRQKRLFLESWHSTIVDAVNEQQPFPKAYLPFVTPKGSNLGVKRLNIFRSHIYEKASKVNKAPVSYTATMLTITKETLRFHNFYAWFSSISPISIGMRLRYPALRAGEAPL